MKFQELKEKLKKDLGKTFSIKNIKKVINKITPKAFKREVTKGNKEPIYTLIKKNIKKSS